MKIRNLQTLLVCFIILWKSSLVRAEWISGWRSWLASRIQSCVCVLTITRYMWWWVFRYVRNPRIESSWIRWWRRHRWIYKTFPEIPCVSQMSGGSASRQDRETVGITLVDWERGIVHCVLIQHQIISRIIRTINFIQKFLNFGSSLHNRVLVFSQFSSWKFLDLLARDISAILPCLAYSWYEFHVMTWQEQCFRGSWAVRRVAQGSHDTRKKTARNVRRTAQPAQQRGRPRSTRAKRNAQQASASGPKTNRHILHSAWFSNHTTRLPVRTSAFLKHTNFLNTDRMRKRDGPTAVHMNPFSTSVFNNSDKDVSSNFRATQISRHGPVHPTLWNTSVF